MINNHSPRSESSQKGFLIGSFITSTLSQIPSLEGRILAIKNDIRRVATLLNQCPADHFDDDQWDYLVELIELEYDHIKKRPMVPLSSVNWEPNLWMCRAATEELKRLRHCDTEEKKRSFINRLVTQS